ncbi:ABC transporter B family member 25 [Hordeum vulgare]|nr:ABC transporter B family member 25 [Hordeum vulgare]
MWSSGRSSGSRSDGRSDLERERRVRLDAARKRGARRWTNRGMSPPASFLIRETKEYDRRHGSSSAAGSSYAVSSSSSGARPLLVKRQWSEEPEDVVADVDAVAAAIAEHSLHEEAERWRHNEEIEDLHLRQAVEANLDAKAKDDEWRRIHEQQRAMYINLYGSGEED